MLNSLANLLTSKITRKKLGIFLEKHKTEQKILDLGSSRGPYRALFPNAITVDIDAAAKPDIVADAHDMHMLKDGEFETILCTEMLEHLYNPFKGIEEMARVLKPGGKLILTTRFVYPIHESPNDYFRFTKYGLQKLLEPYFTQMEIEEEAGTIETLAILLQRIGFQTETLGTRFLKVLWHIKAKILLLFKFLLTKEYGDIRNEKVEKSILVSGYYLTAIKK
ncbi:class I SAM-dependent methyltransferase [Candidatus Peregrinibacteria bacterium]|nr:class I SAM-dependent methyltransferase [Candidatus Peregrinibacteria bacterium]